MKKPIAFMINKKPMYIKKSWWFLYFTDGSVYFDGRIRIVKRQIRPLRIQIRNNGSPSNRCWEGHNQYWYFQEKGLPL